MASSSYSRDLTRAIEEASLSSFKDFKKIFISLFQLKLDQASVHIPIFAEIQMNLIPILMKLLRAVLPQVPEGNATIYTFWDHHVEPMIFLVSKVFDELPLDVQEDFVVIIVHVAKGANQYFKRRLGENTDAIPLLIRAVKTGEPSIMKEAIEGIFALSMVSFNQGKLVEMDAVPVIVEVIGNIYLEKYITETLANICQVDDFQSRVIQILLEKLQSHECSGLLSCIHTLAQRPGFFNQLLEQNGINQLLTTIKVSRDLRCQEMSALIISNPILFDHLSFQDVRAEEELNGTISRLAASGTERAREIANVILSQLNV